MNDFNAGLLRFLQASPTALHAAENAAARLRAAGFTELSERETWALRPGKGYFVRRNGSALAAFRLPENSENPHFQIFAAHGDSPALRLKPAAELAGCGLRLAAETYGGGLWGTWFDRPLSLAGRVLVRRADGALAARLVNLDRDLLMLPSLPIHLNRDANDGVKIQAQLDLCPLLSLDEHTTLRGLLAAELGCAEGDIVSHELTVYCRSEGRCWGANEEFLSSPRLDDLECFYTGLEGFLNARGGRSVQCLVCFDNEETGSGTRQGAAGTFLPDVLARAGEGLGLDAAGLARALAASYLLSADNAHAVHPAHDELYDKLNRTAMNAGIVLKHAVAYSTDGVSDGIFRELCRGADIPVQDFSNRSDLRGGSTLANIAQCQLNLRMADIGLPQLAMHSAYETAGAADAARMAEAARLFFARTLTEGPEGVFRWED